MNLRGQDWKRTRWDRYKTEPPAGGGRSNARPTTK